MPDRRHGLHPQAFRAVRGLARPAIHAQAARWSGTFDRRGCHLCSSAGFFNHLSVLEGAPWNLPDSTGPSHSARWHCGRPQACFRAPAFFCGNLLLPHGGRHLRRASAQPGRTGAGHGGDLGLDVRPCDDLRHGRRHERLQHGRRGRRPVGWAGGPDLLVPGGPCSIFRHGPGPAALHRCSRPARVSDLQFPLPRPRQSQHLHGRRRHHARRLPPGLVHGPALAGGQGTHHARCGPVVLRHPPHGHRDGHVPQTPEWPFPLQARLRAPAPHPPRQRGEREPGRAQDPRPAVPLHRLRLGKHALLHPDVGQLLDVHDRLRHVLSLHGMVLQEILPRQVSPAELI